MLSSMEGVPGSGTHPDTAPANPSSPEIPPEGANDSIIPLAQHHIPGTYQNGHWSSTPMRHNRGSSPEHRGHSSAPVYRSRGNAPASRGHGGSRVGSVRHDGQTVIDADDFSDDSFSCMVRLSLFFTR